MTATKRTTSPAPAKAEAKAGPDSSSENAASSTATPSPVTAEPGAAAAKVARPGRGKAVRKAATKAPAGSTGKGSAKAAPKTARGTPTKKGAARTRARSTGGRQASGGAKPAPNAPQGIETLARTLETAAVFGRENLEAVVESQKIAAKALENVSAELITFSRKAYEESVAAARELSGARSLSELVEKQSGFSRASMEAFITETARLNEIYTRAAREAMQPLAARFAAAAQMTRAFRF